MVKDIRMSIGVLKRLLIKQNFESPVYNCSIYNRVKTLFNIINAKVMLQILKRELGDNFINIQKSIKLCHLHKKEVAEYEKA